MKKGKVLYRIVSFVLTVALLVGFCPQGVSIANFPVTLPEVVASENISNPRKVKDSSMESGQKVTWDCVYFGMYPQSEVTSEDGDIYSTLKNATGWDSNNIVINGIKYRRLKEEDATMSGITAEGQYSWDDRTYHYFKYEPIKWRVLSRNGNDAFLLADVALDDQLYNTNDADVSWEISSIRSWLNGYDASVNEPKTDYSQKNFINAAFTSAQRNTINTTAVINNDNIYWGITGGKNTSDKIFLLSESEVYNTDLAEQFGFIKDRDIGDEARQSRCSTYAYQMGTTRYYDTSEEDKKYNENIVWWLRSPGYPAWCAAQVCSGGWINYSGKFVHEHCTGVRPALHLNLTNTTLYSYAGTVCSDGTKSEVAPPEQPESPEDEFVSNKLKYTLNNAYSFENFSTQVDYKILRKFFNPIVSMVYYLGQEGVDGVCYGLTVSAMATSIYSAPPVKTYNKNQLYDVRMQDKSSSTKISAKDYIKYAYIYQMTESAQKMRANGTKNLDKAYKAVVNNLLHNGEPVALSIRGKIQYTTPKRLVDAGHILWVIGIGKNDEKETELIVYDCNYPGEKRSVWLKKKNGSYTSWTYTLLEGTTWGTGRAGAELLAHNPSTDFVKQFEKVVGYTRAASEQSKLFVSVNNKNSSITNSDNEKLALSPDTDNENLTYIQKDNALPDGPYDENYQFWADVDNEVTFKAGDEQTDCSFASNESGVDLSVPQNTTAEVAVLKKDDNKVKLSMDDTADKYEVTYNTVNQSDGVERLTISGEDTAQFEGNQTKEGIIVEADSLEALKVNLKEVDSDGAVEQLVTKDISTNSKRILINNNEVENKLTVKEDTDGDGKFDKDIVSVFYNKKQNTQKPSSNTTKPSGNTTKAPSIKPFKATGKPKQIAAGKKVNLKAEIGLPDSITKQLIWKSSNTKVATVNANGVVTVKKKTGGKKVTITASNDKIKVSASWKVTSMKGIVKKVKITGAKTVKAGKSLKLKAKVTATKKANKKLQWTSSNTKYATVNAKGVVKTKKTAKRKTIKITAMATDGSGKKATFKIKVK